MWLKFLLLCLLPFTDAAQILAFFPMSHRSHQIAFQQLLTGLAVKGHQITYVTSVPMSESHGNIKETVVNVLGSTNKKPDVLDFTLWRHSNMFKQFLDASRFNIKLCELTFRHPVVQDFLRQKRTYDVIITEVSHFQESFIGLGQIFNAPVIDFSGNCGNSYFHDLFFNPNIYSYVTGWGTPYSDRLTLYERLMNTLVGLFEVYVSYWYYYPIQEEMLHSNFNISNSTHEKPSLRSLMQKHVVGAILNSDAVLGYPRPLMPHTIQVAGITQRPRKPLPQDLQNFMDKADSGVIYFSFGTILQWEKMAVRHKEIFIEAFSRLPQRVLWKYEGDVDLKSPNILMRKWLPQADILAHPNCRLFITHGGYLGFVETVNAAVPIIGIPFFADQPRNIRIAEAKGFGVHLNFDDLTPDMIVDAVQKVLGNKSYSDSAKRVSAIFKDRVVPPLDEAVHFVEYIIRHKSHPGSHTGAKDLWWFQYFLLDVIAIIFAVISAIFLIVYKTIRLVLSPLCGPFSISEKQSANSRKRLKKTN